MNLFHRHDQAAQRTLTAEEVHLRDRRRWHAGILRDVRNDNGGLDIPASLMGALVAISALGLLGVLATAIFTQVIYDATSGSSQGWAGVALGALVVFLAFFFGGWTAARAARYSGFVNGIAVVVWVMLIAVSYSALGYALGKNSALLEHMLPNWLTTSDFTITKDAAISGIAGLVVMLLGSLLGSARGAAYHRRLDNQLLAEPEDMTSAPVAVEAPAQPVEHVKTTEPVQAGSNPAVDHSHVRKASDGERLSTTDHQA